MTFKQIYTGLLYLAGGLVLLVDAQHGLILTILTFLYWECVKDGNI